MNFIGGYRPHQMQAVEVGSGNMVIRRRPNNPGSMRCHFGFHDFGPATDFKTKKDSSLFMYCSRCEAVYSLEDERAFYPECVSDLILQPPPCPPVKSPKVEDQADLKYLISELNYSIKELTDELRRSSGEKDV